MKVLVCGGRDYDDRDAVERALDPLLMGQRDLLITGGARGADWLAQQWADRRGVPCAVFPAAWQRFGVAAGPKRNHWMLWHMTPNLAIAFPGGHGTVDMVKRATLAGIEVRNLTDGSGPVPREEV